jgi:hypothetical protein
VLAFVLGLSLQQASRETPRTPESPVLETVVAASVPSTASPLPVAPSVRVEPAPIPMLAVAQSGSDPTVISPVELAARKQIDALLAKDSLRQPKFNDSLSEVHARRFNAYLLRHSEQASLSSRYGGVPLARVAALNAVGTE